MINSFIGSASRWIRPSQSSIETVATIARERRTLSPLLSALLLFIAMLSASASAQVSGTGTIQGTVTDPLGAVLPKVVVTATNPSTKQTTSTVTTSAGLYVLGALQPGEYNVEFKAKGFNSILQEHIKVDPISVVGLNLALQIGSELVNIVVTAAPPALETENGTLTTTLSSETYDALPVAMSGGPKSPLGFMGLLPGVVVSSFVGGANINGGAQGTSFLYLNGMPLLNPELQGDTRTVTRSTSTEVVSQFQVMTSGIPAFYTGQGIANFVSKSGTNDFHGDLYENVRNTLFDAPGYFSQGVVPVEHQNQYGVSLGGPIIKNRLFFFGNIDWYKITQGSTPTFYSIPTMAERNGDFSAFTQPIYDPATTTCTLAGICSRTQFSYNGVANIIPPSRISRVSASLASELPPTINSNLQNNYLGAFVSGATQNTYMGKADYTISEKHRAYALVQQGHYTPTGQPNNVSSVIQIPLPYGSTHLSANSTWTVQLGETWIVKPNLVNVFGFQYNRFVLPVSNLTINGNYPAKAGLTGLPSGPPSTEFPSIVFAGGLNRPTNWAQGNASYADNANIYTYQDNIQWTKGKHSVTAGAQATWMQHNYTIPNDINLGNSVPISFAAAATSGFDSKGAILTSAGHAYGSYLLGLVSSAAIRDGAVNETGLRYNDYAVYVQDDWKITPKLTVNLGLRYVLNLPYHETQNRLSWLNPTLPNPAVNGYLGALQFSGDGADSCHCKTRIQTHPLAFDPRIGFAYTLHPRTVIRGSFGIMHFNGAALGGSDAVQGTGLLGYQAQPTFNSSDAGISTAFVWDNGFPSYQRAPFFDPTLNSGYNTTAGNKGSGITYDRPDTAGLPPYSENWNITLNHAITPSVIMELTYTGSQTHHIVVPGGLGIFSNQIDPKYLQLGSLLQQTATPTTIAQAQAVFPSIALPYSNFVGSIGQMLRPFPQYNSISDPYANGASANYNAFQTSIQKRMSKGFYLLASYVWSKAIDSDGSTVSFLSSSARSAYNLKAERSVAREDHPHAIKGAIVYALPIGKGQLLNIRNPFLDALLGGWRVSGNFVYQDGTPLGPFTAACNVPYSGGCYPNLTRTSPSNVKINGGWGDGALQNKSHIDVTAFQSPAGFTFGNSPRTLPYNLRNPWLLNEDATLGKNINLTKRVVLRVQADAFNVLNRTVFGGINTTITSTAFGTVSSQANSPRQLQLEGYLRF